MAHEYEVIVGNVGTVYNGGSKAEATKKFKSYVAVSMENRGRAGGENVTMMCDGEPCAEFFGSDPSE